MNNYTYNPYFDVYSDYLAHHGILGMRWGIRRYQPYQGEIPPGSKEVGEAKKVEQREDKKYSDDYLRAKELSKRDIRSLSNDELRTIAERKELEKAVSDRVKTGSSVVKDELVRQGTKLLAKAALTTAAVVGAKYIISHNNITVSSIARKLSKKATDKASDAILKVGDAVTGKAKEAKRAAIKGAGDAILKVGDSVTEKAKDVKKGAEDTILKVGDAITGKAKDVKKGAEDTILKVGDSVTEKAKDVVKSARNSDASKAIAQNKTLQSFGKTVDKFLDPNNRTTSKTIKKGAKNVAKSINKAKNTTVKSVQNNKVLQKYGQTVDKLLKKVV